MFYECNPVTKWGTGKEGEPVVNIRELVSVTSVPCDHIPDFPGALGIKGPCVWPPYIEIGPF